MASTPHAATTQEHVLRDGSVVTLQHVGPEHADALHGLYAGLTREDVRRECAKSFWRP